MYLAKIFNSVGYVLSVMNDFVLSIFRKDLIATHIQQKYYFTNSTNWWLQQMRDNYEELNEPFIWALGEPFTAIEPSLTSAFLFEF